MLGLVMVVASLALLGIDVVELGGGHGGGIFSFVG